MQQLDFVITGLPHSRTNWVAAVLSLGHGICRHSSWVEYRDASKWEESISDLKTKYSIVGESCCSLLLAKPWEYNVKTVIIVRNNADAYLSYIACCKRNGITHADGTDTFEKYTIGMKHIPTLPTIMTIPFIGLETRMESIWKFCYGSSDGYDAIKVDQFSKMVIAEKSDVVRARTAWIGGN